MMGKDVRGSWRRLGRRVAGGAAGRQDVDAVVVTARRRHAALIQQAGQLVGRRRAAEVEAREAAAAAARVERGVRWAISSADKARQDGRPHAADEFDAVAERLADELVALEHRVAVLEAAARIAGDAAAEGQRLVQVDAQALRHALGEAARLVLQVDETNLLEATLPADTSGTGLEDVRDRIEGRYARALAETELYGRGRL